MFAQVRSCKIIVARGDHNVSNLICRGHFISCDLSTSKYFFGLQEVAFQDGRVRKYRKLQIQIKCVLSERMKR